MTNIKLSKRLNAIASMVTNTKYLADIGCDHALLDIYLIKQKIIEKSIACDITEGALNQAKKNIMINNITKIETRLGDGLEKITAKDRIDTIVLSGLGNVKIREILFNGKDKLKDINTIIIQSNTNCPDIRKTLIDLGYNVSDEVIVKENNIFYIVIKFVKGIKKYSDREIYFGPVLLANKDKLFKEMYDAEIKNNNKIIRKLPYNKISRKIKLYILNFKIKKEIKNL